MQTLWQDLRYGARMLLKQSGFFLMAVLMLSLPGNAQQAKRLFQPEDLFRLWQVAAVAWSPDGHYAAIEILRPGHTLDRTAPTGEIRLLNVRTRTWRTLSSNACAY